MTTKKLLVGFSLSLWMAALALTPAPANAGYWGKYAQNVGYFSCSQYATISPIQCNKGEAQLFGQFTHKIPLSACSGSCNGSETLKVQGNTGNGRKTASYVMLCGTGYLLDFSPCSGC